MENGEKQPSLGELSISETTSDSLLLSWSVPTGSFDSFLVQYEDGGLQSLPVGGASREMMVSSLTPSRSYQFDLYGISGGQRLGPISTKALTGQYKPLTPDSLPWVKGKGKSFCTAVFPNLGYARILMG